MKRRRQNANNREHQMSVVKGAKMLRGLHGQGVSMYYNDSHTYESDN